MAAFPIGLIVTAALAAAQMALSMTRKIEGPRLEDLKVTVSDYGTPLNYFYGTRRFNGVPIIWAKPIREQKRRRKTKGGKVNEYTYFGTWAVAVADHEIDGVTRIWFDKHLVYDTTGAGPISPFTLSKRKTITEVMRIYLGTETQQPDPTMLAAVEAEFGAGTCPAYRGVAYILFDDVPLEKLGNRIPQIAVEAVANGAAAYPYEAKTPAADWENDTAGTKAWPALSAGGTRFANELSNSSLAVWDMVTRTKISQVTVGHNMGSTKAIDLAGNIYWCGIVTPSDPSPVYRANPDGTGSTLIFTCSGTSDSLQIVTDGGGREYVLNLPYSVISKYWLDGVEFDIDFIPTMGCTDAYGDIWIVGATYDANSVANLQRIINYSGRAVADAPTFAHSKTQHIPEFEICHNAAAGHFFVIDKVGTEVWYLIDDETFAINSSGTWSLGHTNLLYVTPDRNSHYAVGSTTSYEFSLQTAASIRSFTMANWTATPTDSGFYDPISHALVSYRASGLTWRFLDRTSGNGVTLDSIVADVCQRCDIASTDRTTSDLNQVVKGWSWTQGSGKSIIEPLLDFYDSDVRPHDFKVEFLKRTGTAAGTIDVEEFAVSQDAPRYGITIAQDTDLPRRITLTFADPDGEQQPNSVIVQRPLANMDGVRELSVDLSTLVLSIDEARQGAERYFRRLWNSRETYALSLTAQRMALEPADVWNLGLDSVTRTARATKLTFAADDSLKMEWKQDSPLLSAVISTPGAPQDGRVPSVIMVPVLSEGFLLDLPLLRDQDADTNPLIYYGAGPYASGLWPGADIFQGDGTTYETEFAGVASDAPTTWGRATGALASATHYVWDRGNSVNVSLYYGTLTNATEAACNANPRLNLALLGSELIQFTTATLQGDGSYTLTGLKRGRRGSEWAVGTHASGERFVMLDNIAKVEMGAGDIGDTLYFNTVTLGREDGMASSLSYTGASNKPWAPAQFRAVKDSASGDWTFTWARRSRVAGDFLPASPALGESAENYKVKIYRSGFGSAATRTITATSQTATYTAAQQVTDGGAVAVGDLDAGVLQVGNLADGFETQVAF